MRHVFHLLLVLSLFGGSALAQKRSRAEDETPAPEAPEDKAPEIEDKIIPA